METMESGLIEYWNSVGSYLPGILYSCVVVMEIALLSIVFSWILGLFAALGKNSRLGILRYPCEFYIWFMRGTPSLIQIFIIYFALPQLGLTFSPFVAGVIALSIGSGAYVAEVFRSGLAAIPTGQGESAQALGMGPILMMRRIVLPQVVRIVVPALTNEAINTLKNTSLLSTITVLELTLYTQMAIAATFRPFEFYIAAALLYLVMTTVLSQFAHWHEKRYTLHI